MHQSGTHYLKFRLGHAMSEAYGVPPPRYNHANELIGGLKDPIEYPALPRLPCSHSLAHVTMGIAAVHALLPLPRYVVLVRDIRASLVSNYEKWRGRYACEFDDFLRGDPSGGRFTSDIWWCLRFLNGWTAVRRAVPERVLVIHYERLCAAPAATLAVVARHFDLALDSAAIAAGVAQGSKATMLARSDPARPQGIVNPGHRDLDAWYSRAAADWLARVCAQWLDDAYGYDYTLAFAPTTAAAA